MPVSTLQARRIWQWSAWMLLAAVLLLLVARVLPAPTPKSPELRFGATSPLDARSHNVTQQLAMIRSMFDSQMQGVYYGDGCDANAADVLRLTKTPRVALFDNDRIGASVALERHGLKVWAKWYAYRPFHSWRSGFVGSRYLSYDDTVAIDIALHRGGLWRPTREAEHLCTHSHVVYFEACIDAQYWATVRCPRWPEVWPDNSDEILVTDAFDQIRDIVMRGEPSSEESRP